MLLYFSVVGGLIYKIFVATPNEQGEDIKIKSTQSTVIDHNAADINIG